MKMVWPTPIIPESSLVAYSGAPRMQLHASYAKSYMEHLTSLDITSEPAPIRLTAIIVTIGPATDSVEIVEQLLEKGMNIARVNVSHGKREHHARTFRNIRRAVEKYSMKMGFDYPLAIALDTKGPEIRTGILETGEFSTIELKKGDKVKLTTDPAYMENCSNLVIFVDYEGFQKLIKVGNLIYIDNGYIALVCTSIAGAFVTCTIEMGGVLGSRKGINLPGVKIDLPAVSERDKIDILFGLEQNVDIIFCSFIRNADGIKQIRGILGNKGRRIKIISKIENAQGLENMDEIVKASDGIVVARGDLAIEAPIEKLFLLQKAMITRCIKAGIPVCCGSELLVSMVKKSRPTRAEGTDAANAVLDGCDSLLLVSETSTGDYPVACITTLAKMSKEAEAAAWVDDIFKNLSNMAKPPLDPTHSIAISAVEASLKCVASAIIVSSTLGRAAFLISRYRPRCPILIVTRDAQTARQSQLYRAIVGLLYKEPAKAQFKDEMYAQNLFALNFGKKFGFIKSSDPIIVVHEIYNGIEFINDMSIYYVDETLNIVDDTLFVTN